MNTDNRILLLLAVSFFTLISYDFYDLNTESFHYLQAQFFTLIYYDLYDFYDLDTEYFLILLSTSSLLFTDFK